MWERGDEPVVMSLEFGVRSREWTNENKRNNEVTCNQRPISSIQYQICDIQQPAKSKKSKLKRVASKHD